jgi:hypothetical protein
MRRENPSADHVLKQYEDTAGIEFIRTDIMQWKISFVVSDRGVGSVVQQNAQVLRHLVQLWVLGQDVQGSLPAGVMEIGIATMFEQLDDCHECRIRIANTYAPQKPHQYDRASRIQQKGICRGLKKVKDRGSTTGGRHRIAQGAVSKRVLRVNVRTSF